MSKITTTTGRLTRGYYHYNIECPCCGGSIEVRVSTGMYKPFRCPCSPDCYQYFKQIPQQYGRKPYITTIETPGRWRPTKETP